MRKTLLALCLIFITTGMQAQIAINTNAAAPNASAMLDISSTNKGMLIPRMTSAQRTAIVSPANGLMVYDTDVKSFWFYNGAVWTVVGGAAAAPASFTLPYDTLVNQSPSAFKITNDGTGAAIQGHSKNPYGIGMRASSEGIGGWGLFATTTRPNSNSIYAYSDSGTIIRAMNNYSGNTNPALDLLNKGQGPALNLNQENSVSEASAVFINNNSGGTGIELHQSNLNTFTRGIQITNHGMGDCIAALSYDGSAFTGFGISDAPIYSAFNSKGAAFHAKSKAADGDAGISVTNDSTGYAIQGLTGVLSIHAGIAGRFENFYSGNSKNVFEIESNGTGTLLSLKGTHTTGPANALYINNYGTGNHALFQTDGVNKARISNTGGGYFNGGTFNSGADVAEVFEVTGNKQQYEPGDVLVISIDKDRAVEKSSGPYSTLVAGVYATKPGVTLSENNIDSLISDNEVPMGVIGVIPTKVCLEGGAIKRGDLLVTSSTPGIAMKGDINKVKVGQVIGKALENFNSASPGRIRVLVSIK